MIIYLLVFMMSFLTTSGDVRKAIDNSMRHLFYLESDGTAHPYVCLICDSFTGPNFCRMKPETLEKKKDYFKVNTNLNLNLNLRKCYLYKGLGEANWMEDCWLSNRGIYTSYGGGHQKYFIVCKECETNLRQNQRPEKAIANGWFTGQAPKVIEELTEQELAFLTPAGEFGYCFSWNGGRNRKLAGTLAYYKLEKESVVATLEIASKLSKMLNSNVVYILHGEMTEDQQRIVKLRSEIRPAKVRPVLEWLVANHCDWEGVPLTDFDDLMKNKKPTVVDLSKKAPAMGEDVDENERTRVKAREKEETFAVYFPDGTMTDVCGGQKSVSEFEKIVCEAQSKGFRGTVISDLNREFTYDYLSLAFVNSCILQFPYGRGGPCENRLTKDDDEWSIDLSKYAKYLSYSSDPNFHTAIFVLKLFNMKLRDNILRGSRQRLNGDMTIWNLRNNLSLLNFSKAAAAKAEDGKVIGDKISRNLIRGLESVQKGLPHSDAAARCARQYMATLQNHFGLGGIFLTVTPDDENTFLVTAYSQVDKRGKPIDISNLTSEQLNAQAEKRKEVRLKFPGITALNFEYVLDVVIKEVIGWDVSKGQPTGKPGLFGIPVAFGGAVEEQGRTTLHVHFIIWLLGFIDYLNNINSENTRTQLQAKRHICQVVNNTISTELISFEAESRANNNKAMERQEIKTFDHNCKKRIRERSVPTVVDVQQLRNLRHQAGHKHDAAFAMCPDCDKKWTSEEMVFQYLVNHKKLKQMTSFPDSNKYLESMCYEYTKPGFTGQVNPSIVHAKADHHLSSHTKSCFKNSKKRSSQNKPIPYGSECRMHFPQLPQKITATEALLFGENKSVDFYSWTGEKTERQFFEVNPKRRKLDLFTNAFVPALGESKIGGNSNARVITPGPVGVYTIKYPTKSTQDENAKPYENVITSLTAVFNKVKKHELDRAESLRLVIISGFAANKTNIIGSSQAAFLTRRNSRFLWSHDFAFVPLKDLLTLLNKGKLDSFYVRSNKGKPFADIHALHYLCRPLELSNVTAKQFFEEFEVVGSDVKNRPSDLLGFINTEHFQHQSNETNEKGNSIGVPQFVRCRDKKRLAWVVQMDFVDTAKFEEASILNCSVITDEMENYACNILVLCTDYRSLDDLKINGSFVLKLRFIHQQGKLKEYCNFLQNLQDSRANFTRIRPTHDQLQKNTEPFRLPDDKKNSKKQEDIEEEEFQGQQLDDFLETMEQHFIDGEDDDSENSEAAIQESNYMPMNLNLNRIRNKGAYFCGKDNLCGIPVQKPELNNDTSTNFIITSNINNIENRDIAENLEENQEPKKPNFTTILGVLFEKIGLGCNRLVFEKDMKLPEANGSALSITNWARLAKLDPEQTRAFEVFTASFILTFFRDAEKTMDIKITRNQEFRKEKLKLTKLAGRLPVGASLIRLARYLETNLVCLLHGPGGSGKTAVMDLLKAYGKEYCNFVDVIFTPYTIIASALTGVAATLINGRTIHSFAHLNKLMKNITRMEKDEWRHTRLVIIDEVSFASKQEIIEIDKKLKYLTGNSLVLYGGLNVIFCGDFRQLEPVGDGAIQIYQEQFTEFHGAINTYIELCGMHRFRFDLPWGNLLTRLRDGAMSDSDIEIVNTRVVTKNEELPSNVTYATYRNVDRTSINNGLFQKYCSQHDIQEKDLENCLIIFSSDLERRVGNMTFSKPSNKWETFFWTNCGEGDCKPAPFNNPFDPVLLLYYNRPMMVVINGDVEHGVANGSRCHIIHVHLKPGETYTKIKFGFIEIPAVRANQIAWATMKHENENMIPRVFNIKPKKNTFFARVPYPDSMQPGTGKNKVTLKVMMRGTQMPIICNNATTGHKLQGTSIESLFIHASTTVRNWMYVVLSRVKTLKGLYLRKPLDKKDLAKFNDIPELLKELITLLRQNKLKTAFSDEDYEAIFNTDLDNLVDRPPT